MDTRNDVKDFMIACDQLVNDKPVIGESTYDQSKLYMKLIKEEFDELTLAFGENDLVEVADACADLIWVIQGLAHTLGIPQQEVWDEVNRSNVAKYPGGKVLRRADGKIMKPEGWEPPNIKS